MLNLFKSSKKGFENRSVETTKQSESIELPFDEIRGKSDILNFVLLHSHFYFYSHSFLGIAFF